MRILIVDDSNVVREIVETALRHLGLELHDVMHAANGQQGIAALDLADTRGEALDLILCDVHMPVMNGLDFLLEKARRNLAPGVPVAMITADATDPDLLRAICAGAQGHIAKPFTLRQMQTQVLSLIGA
jgi:two-component system chemotaxis response regulator CheY